MADAFKAQGNAEFSAGKFAEAVQSFSQAIALDADNHVLYSNRSGAYTAMGNFAKAKEDAESAVAKNPKWFKGYSRLGAALHGLKQYDAALKEYETALSLADGANKTTIEGNIADVRRDVEAAAAPPPQANPFAKVFGPDCLQKIAANPKLLPLLVKPGFEQKIRMLMANPSLINSMMSDQDVMTVFLELMGLSGQFRTGAPGKPGADAAAQGGDDDGDDDDNSAAERLRAARREAEARRAREESVPPASPKPPAKAAGAAAAAPMTPALLAKEEGNKLYQARQFDAALAKYDEAIALDPTNTTFLLNRTAVLFEQGKFEEVLAETERAIEHAKEHKADYQVLAKVMTRRASTLQKLQRHAEAIELFKQALLEHRNPDTLAKLTACEVEKKKLDEEAYLDPALALKAKEEGNAAYKAEQYPVAVKHYNEAIKRNPRDHVLYSNRAGALIKLMAFDDAVRDCDKCIELCPTFARAYARKGQAYLLTKQLHRALQAYEEGLKQDPNNDECKEGRARCVGRIQEVSSSDGNEDVAARAMQDPEIQNILHDPYMQLVLREVQTDPTRLNDYMRDARIAANINKLVAAGVIRTGGPSSGGAAHGGGRRK
jgi:stress-induced-phosphoprotein 1